MESKILKAVFSCLVIFSCRCYLSCQAEGLVIANTVSKTNVGAIEQRVKKFFDDLTHLMRKCDQFIAYWRKCEKNVDVYMISHFKLKNWKNERRDTLMHIRANIKFLEGKKREYATPLGKLYKVAEPFIDETFKTYDAQEQERILHELSENINDLVDDSLYQEQMKHIKKFGPPDNSRKKKMLYYAGAVGGVIASGILLYYRKSVVNLVKNFFMNQIIKPLRSLKNCLFGSHKEDAFLRLSVDDLLKDLEAQKYVLKEKIKDLVVQADPDVGREALDGIIEQAKKEGLEHFVARCIKKASEVPKKRKKTKQGWIEWFVLGDKISKILGMDPQDKVLELEIKALLTRLSATKMMVDAKDALDSNKLTLVMGSCLPAVVAISAVYAACKRVYNRVNGVYRKKEEINQIICHINEIINRNISRNNNHLSYEDQGFLCFYACRFKRCLSVVSEAMRSSFEKDITYISSSLNSINKKLQILQSMKIMLYAG